MASVETEMDSTRRKVFYGALALLALVLLRTAWVCDDAYISFRTVDNFVHGYGLRWNVDERVWTFTNPLWVLVFSAVYAVTHEAYYSSIIFSILLATGGVTLLVKGLARSTAVALLMLAACICSKAFVDYSTSGLENVLTHFTLVVFLVIWLHGEMTFRRLFWLSLVGSLATLNRMDTILLILPALVGAWWPLRGWRATRMVVLGFLPFMLWEVFALIFYGFLFPNTYYAKTHVGISTEPLIRQGLHYLAESIWRDPVTFVTIISGTVGVLFVRARRGLLIAAGIGLYLVYVVKVGGDFMSGRFLTAPFVCGVALVSLIRLPERGWKLCVPFAAIFALSFLGRTPTILSGSHYGEHEENGKTIKGIVDERAWYYQQSGLLRANRDSLGVPHSDWVQKRFVDPLGRDSVVISGNIGFPGYYAGSSRYLIDICALSDPLLSKLPCETRRGWRIGHFFRNFPPGYEVSVRTGKNKIEDSSLAEYYEHLNQITRGELFSSRRLAEIVNFNLGQREVLLNRYVNAPMTDIPYAQLQAAANAHSNTPQSFHLNQRGIRVSLDSVFHVARVIVTTECRDKYLLVFRRDTTCVGYAETESARAPSVDGCTDTLAVPEQASKDGYTSMEIIGYTGDAPYVVLAISLVSQ